MNTMTTPTILSPSGACAEPIRVFESKSEDISPGPERDPTGNLVLPRRARCFCPSGDSSNIDARQPRAYLSPLERAAHEGRRDSFRCQGCVGAVHSWHRRRHRGNSNPGRWCSFRSQDHTDRRRQGLEHTPDRPRHHWNSCQELWNTSAWARTVSAPGTVKLRAVPGASTAVLGVPRRVVSQNGGRGSSDSELDDDPYDQCRVCRPRMPYFQAAQL